MKSTACQRSIIYKMKQVFSNTICYRLRNDDEIPVCQFVFTIYMFKKQKRCGVEEFEFQIMNVLCKHLLKSRYFTSHVRASVHKPRQTFQIILDQYITYMCLEKSNDFIRIISRPTLCRKVNIRLLQVIQLKITNNSQREIVQIYSRQQSKSRNNPIKI